MILKKPYAVFIKYFKLLHGVMSFLIAFILFRFFDVYNFFRIYSIDYRAITAGQSIANYFDVLGFIFLLFILVINALLLTVMFYKKKPVMLYICNIILYIITLAFYYYGFSSFRNISEIVLDVRVAKAFRDFFFIISIIQFVSLVMVIIRAIGFDIKRFDFVSDLQKLDISEKDSEEIEVSLEFDFYEVRKKIVYFFRRLKYFYFEHKFLINIVSLVFLIFVGLLIYHNSSLYASTYSEGESFSSGGFVYEVVDSYIVDSGFQNNKLVITSGDYAGAVVVVRLKVKTSGISKPLNNGLMSLKIGDLNYLNNMTYVSDLRDLGEAYYDEKITSDYQMFIFAYEILDSFTSKKIKLRINDSTSIVKGQIGAKNIYVDLKPIDLRASGESFNKSVGNQISFEKSILKNSSLIINSFDVNSRFKLNYNYCIRTDNCINSSEYVTASTKDNYYKVLLRLSGKYVSDSDYSSVTDIRSLLNSYGTIYYLINDKWYSRKINSSLIKPTVAQTNDTFIEVPYEVKDASEIYLKINIRNQSYKYVLK